MGGHALKKVNASRISLIEYNKIKSELMDKFAGHLDIEFIIDVPNKQDFGDIDVLYTLDSNLSPTNCQVNKSNKFDIINLIKSLFNPVEIVPSGLVISFAYKLAHDDEDENGEDGNVKSKLNTHTQKYFQVDLIYCKDIQMSRFYFSYGDLGGIIGRICQHVGLKYGFDGLWLNPNPETILKYLDKTGIKNRSYQIDIELIANAHYQDIILLTNPEEICQFLGLDWNKWTSGFDSTEQIFIWIIQSKWFKKNSFRALNCEHRRRADKRPMYQNFLQYIFEDEPKRPIEKSSSTKYINLNIQLETIELFDKTSQLEQMILECEKKIIRKNKFSGKIFVDMGFEGKKINQMMDSFKKHIETLTQLDFNTWLDLNNLDYVKLMVNEFANSGFNFL